MLYILGFLLLSEFKPTNILDEGVFSRDILYMNLSNVWVNFQHEQLCRASINTEQGAVFQDQQELKLSI